MAPGHLLFATNAFFPPQFSSASSRHSAVITTASTNGSSVPLLRWLCLALCSLLAIGQLWLFQVNLLGLNAAFASLGSSLSTTPGAILPFSTAGGRKEGDFIEGINSSSSSSFRLPDCLIIGVRKGGTRALLDAIALHPRVKVARHEVHFFDNEEHFRLGPDWYRAQMPIATEEEVIIEKTPAYFTANPKVPKRVFDFNPKMRFILIIREPVMRTISDFTQIQQTKRERHKPALEFQKMSFLRGQNGTIALNPKFKPIRNSLYAQHLGRWLKYFPLSKFLVLDGDKFIKDPLSQLRLVERFLGLEPAIRPAQLVFNPNKGFFCFRPESNTTAHCLGQSKGRKQLNITSDFRRLLTEHFVPHNQQFFALLNRQFPSWNQHN